MALDEVVNELADVLDRTPDMPFAQYMLKLPDRGGLYHLTLTAPGQKPPQNTVTDLEKEREGLRSQVSALEPLATAVVALQAHVSAEIAKLRQHNEELGAQVESNVSDLSTMVKAFGDQAEHQATVSAQSGRDAHVLISEVREFSNFIVDGFGKHGEVMTKKADLVLQRTQELQSFMGQVTAFLRKAKETDESLISAFSMYEQIMQDWAIETRNELQRSNIDLAASIQDTLTTIRETVEVLEGYIDLATQKMVSGNKEAVEFVKATVTGVIERVTAAQQDVLRHITGATAASREGAEATLAAVNGARTDVLKYLTVDVAEATEAMQQATRPLIEHDSLVTRIFALESELGAQNRVLDAAERLVHSVKDVPQDLLSTPLQELRAAVEQA